MKKEDVFDFFTTEQIKQLQPLQAFVEYHKFTQLDFFRFDMFARIWYELQDDIISELI